MEGAAFGPGAAMWPTGSCWPVPAAALSSEGCRLIRRQLPSLTPKTTVAPATTLGQLTAVGKKINRARTEKVGV